MEQKVEKGLKNEPKKQDLVVQEKKGLAAVLWKIGRVDEKHKACVRAMFRPQFNRVCEATKQWQ